MLVLKIDGALDCVLFLDDLTLIAKALNAYQECCFDEIKADGTQQLCEGLTSTLETGAYAVSFSKETHSARLRRQTNVVRQALHLELIPDPEVAV